MIHVDYNFQFVGGNLALDFINTVAFRADAEKREDQLQRADDMRRRANHAQLPDLKAINSSPQVGSAALRYIRTVREQLFVVFHAIASGDRIRADTLVSVGNALHGCRAKRRLNVDGAEVRWVWRASARYADYLLFSVLTAATELLTSDARVGASMRSRRLRLVVPGSFQRPQKAVVQHGGLWQPE